MPPTIVGLDGRGAAGKSFKKSFRFRSTALRPAEYRPTGKNMWDSRRNLTERAKPVRFAAMTGANETIDSERSQSNTLKS
jgi:hypothetical protein